jgi:nitrile hydratase
MLKKEDLEKLWSQIVKRTWTDEVFKQRLIKNPKQVIKDEYRIDVPSNIGIKIVEAQANDVILRLPPNQASEELSAEQLKKVFAAGGEGAGDYISDKYIHYGK